MQAIDSHDQKDTVPPRRRQPPTWTNAALLAISLLAGFALVEAGYRIAAGLPLLKIANWRIEQVVVGRLGERAVVDPVLGWTLKPWTTVDEFTTLDHGIRQNFGETTIRTGAVLAVGDSFTEGWEVANHQSWPAVVEHRIGLPVVNGGIGAFGTDQIVLRAEQLLPVIKPKILMIGFLEIDIERSEHSSFGGPKPYFTLVNGELRYHPPGPIDAPATPTLLSAFAVTLRNGLGYSAAADRLLARLSPGYWYGTRSFVHNRDIDGVAVTCALLRRLKARTDREGIRLMLFMQYYAWLLEADTPTKNAQGVMDCARTAGIRVVDQFASLRVKLAAHPDAVAEYYVLEGARYGHMAAKGNEHAASLVIPALRDWLADLAGNTDTASTPANAARGSD